MFSSFSMDGSKDAGEANGDLLITKMFLRIAPFLSTVRLGSFSLLLPQAFFYLLFAIFLGV
jgi:hypothetical protein